MSRRTGGGLVTMVIVGAASVMLIGVPALAAGGTGTTGDASGLLHGVSEAMSKSAAKQPLTWFVLGAGAVSAAGLLVAKIVRNPAFPVPTRDVMAHPSWVWLSAAFLVWAMVAMAGSFAVAAKGGADAPSSKAIASLAGGSVGVIAGIILARIMALSAPNAGLAFRLVDIWRGLFWFLVAIPILLSTSMLAVWARTAMEGKEPGPIAHDALALLVQKPGDPSSWAIIASAALLAPIWEEICYRGLVQSALARALPLRSLAVVVTAGLFAAAHYSAVPAHALPVLFVLGLLLGHAFERTRRIGVPMTMHVLFNVANVVLALKQA